MCVPCEGNWNPRVELPASGTRGFVYAAIVAVRAVKSLTPVSPTGEGAKQVPPDEPEVGPGARRKLYEMFIQAIPDARGEVLDVIAEGDKVVLVDRFGGTHHGEFLGRPGTGDRIEWMAIHIYTIRDGKVLQDAYMRDELAIAQQLGLVPSA